MNISRASDLTFARRLPWLSLVVWLLLVPIAQLAHQAWEPHYLCRTHGVVEHGDLSHDLTRSDHSAPDQPAPDQPAPDQPAPDQPAPYAPKDHHDSCELSLISTLGDHPTRVCAAVTIAFLPTVVPLGTPTSTPLSRQPPLTLAPKTSPPASGIACI